MFERFKKPKAVEVDQKSLRQPSEEDPRVMLYTAEELAKTSEYALVDRTGGKIDGGWRVVGVSDDGEVKELHKDGVNDEGDPVTLIKVRTIEQLREAQLLYEDARRQEALDQEAYRQAFAADAGKGAVALVDLERDENGMIVMPEWSQPATVESSADADVEPAAEREAALREALYDLCLGVDATDLRYLQRYAMYLNEKERAQKSGQGEASIQQAQFAGEELKRMSPAARDISSRYWDITRQM